MARESKNTMVRPDEATIPVERQKAPFVEADRSSHVGTTHDVHGGGHPRLVPEFYESVDLAISFGLPERIKGFALVPGTTTIGSDPTCDVCLPGLEPNHAEIRRDRCDDYKVLDVSVAGTTRVDGRKIDGHPLALHAGNRVQFGPWVLTYERDEFADHGAPFGGTSGEGTPPFPVAQPVPRPRGTSPTGGSEPTADDPGEYF